tara:strand:- start:379 stop:744 length:366 start_codon:yes stop_codon:yes gene_type:complete
MRPYQANLLNSATLILMPLWAYLTFVETIEKPELSMTAFIPLIFGVILLFCSIGIKKENKIIAHIAVLITFIALIGLAMPLKAAILENRSLSILRVAAMMLTSSLAMFAFIKSFIKARQNK